MEIKFKCMNHKFTKSLLEFKSFGTRENVLQLLKKNLTCTV